MPKMMKGERSETRRESGSVLVSTRKPAEVRGQNYGLERPQMLGAKAGSRASWFWSQECSKKCTQWESSSWGFRRTRTQGRPGYRSFLHGLSWRIEWIKILRQDSTQPWPEKRVHSYKEATAIVKEIRTVRAWPWEQDPTHRKVTISKSKCIWKQKSNITNPHMKVTLAMSKKTRLHVIVIRTWHFLPHGTGL